MKHDMNIRSAIDISLTLTATIILMFGSSAAAATTEQVLYSFNPAPDGIQPQAGLIFDAAGNLYGTTSGGGDFTLGAVFELSPSGGWTEKVLYSFKGGTDGGGPVAGLTLDGAGNLYGTTAFGGKTSSSCGGGCGVVFKLTRASQPPWAETVLHSFSGPDGQEPDGDLVFDSACNLYGTTRGRRRSQSRRRVQVDAVLVPTTMD